MAAGAAEGADFAAAVAAALCLCLARCFVREPRLSPREPKASILRFRHLSCAYYQDGLHALTVHVCREVFCYSVSLEYSRKSVTNP